MSGPSVPRWLEWAREIQALAQTGYHYAENHYQQERYQRLVELAAEIIRVHTGLPFEPLLGVFKEQAGYATPRVDVRGAVFRDGRLLLVREASDGGWCMPGGWMDVGDEPSLAAAREVWEEAGFKVRPVRLVGVYDANRVQPLELFHAVKLVFLCELLGGEATPSLETTEVAFFGPHELPFHLSSERTHLRHIADAFAALANPDRPAAFD